MTFVIPTSINRTQTERPDATHESGLDLWFADFPTAEWPDGAVFEFTCFGEAEQRWQGHNWQVRAV